MNKFLSVLIIGTLSLNTFLIIKSIDDKREITRLRQVLVDTGFAEYKVENNSVKYIEYPLDYGTYAEGDYIDEEDFF